MKRSITATGLLSLVAMILVGVFSTGSASAVSQFLWTGPLPGVVLVLSTNTQFFQAIPGGAPIECAHFGARGLASNGKAMTTKEITLIGTYSKCKAAGLFSATVSTAEYLLNANGSVAVVGSPIVVTVPELNCTLKISASANGAGPNSNLNTIKFLNEPQSILAHVEVIEGIISLSSGGECGKAGEEFTKGTYRGLLLASVDGGTLQWDA